MARKVKQTKTVLMYSAILDRENRDTDRVEIHDKRSSSKKEHKGNALASGAEERRDKLR